MNVCPQKTHFPWITIKQSVQQSILDHSHDIENIWMKYKNSWLWKFSNKIRNINNVCTSSGMWIYFTFLASRKKLSNGRIFPCWSTKTTFVIVIFMNLSKIELRSKKYVKYVTQMQFTIYPSTSWIVPATDVLFHKSITVFLCSKINGIHAKLLYTL